MISDDKKLANAVGGKTARACDSCLLRRARWFCAADDAFLCHPCDTSVHAANRLAGRHERLRLHSSSPRTFSPEYDQHSPPRWLRGLTRKARTPRSHGKAPKDGDIIVVEKATAEMRFVPEMGGEEDGSPLGDRREEENELLYRVPVFDPFTAELELGHKPDNDNYDNDDHDHELENQIQGFLQSELELAEFAADVESLLGVDDVKSFGLMDDPKDGGEVEEDFDIDIDIGIDLDGVCGNNSAKVEQRVKVEADEAVLGFQVNPNFGSPATNPSTATEMKKREILLRLNYEAVIAAWDSQGSPWTTGTRPEVKPEHGWPDCMDITSAEFQQRNGDWRGLGSGRGDGGREARVSRYREKRRTRLFSKKIRYEVRKLNAEKRPRMKGRFVKRTSSFMGINNTTFPNNNITTIPSSTFPYHFMKK